MYPLSEVNPEACSLPVDVFIFHIPRARTPVAYVKFPARPPAGPSDPLGPIGPSAPSTPSSPGTPGCKLDTTQCSGLSVPKMTAIAARICISKIVSWDPVPQVQYESGLWQQSHTPGLIYSAQIENCSIGRQYDCAGTALAVARHTSLQANTKVYPDQEYLRALAFVAVTVTRSVAIKNDPRIPKEHKTTIVGVFPFGIIRYVRRNTATTRHTKAFRPIFTGGRSTNYGTILGTRVA